MKCPRCEAANPDTVKFCGECGTPLPPVRGQEPVTPEPSASPGAPSSFPKSPKMPSETLRLPVQELTTGATFAGRYQLSHIGYSSRRAGTQSSPPTRIGVNFCEETYRGDARPTRRGGAPQVRKENG